MVRLARSLKVTTTTSISLIDALGALASGLSWQPKESVEVMVSDADDGFEVVVNGHHFRGPHALRRQALAQRESLRRELSSRLAADRESLL